MADFFFCSLLRYFDAFARQNISFWGVNPQNEPSQGYNYASSIPVMGWSPEAYTEWVANYLGPTLEKGGYGNLKLMILDDNRMWLPNWVNTVLANEKTNKYSSGIAIHWYTDSSSSDVALRQAHEAQPDKYLMYTEACNLVRVTREDLGDWEVGERYANSMLQAFNNWVVGWTDWNMALNEDGGPATFNDNPTIWGYNAAIIVNATADEFYKQPPYYFQAHYSMFVPPGSVHIQLTYPNPGGLLHVAFLTPENNVVVILYNG
uniref:Glucosylceramidase n=1 Tax=Timema californicum TaxID=61474 RepID=A0A7R9J6P7_TIMCA|nr:unnamed protein product [Timema californicum]